MSSIVGIVLTAGGLPQKILGRNKNRVSLQFSFGTSALLAIEVRLNAGGEPFVITGVGAFIEVIAAPHEDIWVSSSSGNGLLTVMEIDYSSDGE